MRLVTLACALLLLLLAGCAGAESGLKKRAAQYYNYMVGLSPRTQFASFLSPAYRKSFAKETLKKMNGRPGGTQQANQRYEHVSPSHISVVIEGRFAYSNISNELGQAFGSIGPARWVRVGAKWYLYSSSGAEQKAYGSFPSGVSPPAPPAIAPTGPTNR